jgi:predicted MFS family arabinose efflux permease
MLVVGFVLLICFALWERFGATVPFLPWHLLRNRNVLGACLLSVTYQISYYCWASYFTSYLQVVYGVSIATAGYISSIFDVVNGVNLFIVGILIRKTGRFKWILLIGVPLFILGVGLMIYFRQPNWSVGYTVMCQVFMALAGGVIIIGQQVSVMSVCEHNEIASVLAMLNLFGNIGGSIGNSVSGAIWTNTLPDKLAELLPASAQESLQDIYDSLDVQLSYPMGSEERDAIIGAYASSQRLMLIAGTCIMVLALICVALIKDINLRKIQQTKGLVF